MASEKNFYKSIRSAFRGIIYTISSQRNMQIHICCSIIAIIFSTILKISKIEWTMIVYSIALVIITELLNTALETSVDLTTKKTKARAMVSKDIAAGAVLFAACNALIIASFIFYPYIYNFYSKGGL